jgi:hypothetical protein
MALLISVSTLAMLTEGDALLRGRSDSNVGVDVYRSEVNALGFLALLSSLDLTIGFFCGSDGSAVTWLIVRARSMFCTSIPN